MQRGTTYTQGIEPAPVGIAREKAAGWHAAVGEGEHGRALEAEALDVCVAHAIVVDLVEVLACVAAAAEQRAEEGAGRGLFVVGADDVHAHGAVGLAHVVIYGSSRGQLGPYGLCTFGHYSQSIVLNHEASACCHDMAQLSGARQM